jgi:hypothetical protein
VLPVPMNDKFFTFETISEKEVITGYAAPFVES